MANTDLSVRDYLFNQGHYYDTEAHNTERAIHYYTLSSDLGSYKAQTNLAMIYEAKKDYIKAIKYYSMAIKHNDYKAAYNLGRMYMYGIGVDQNFKKAMECYMICFESVPHKPEIVKAVYDIQYTLMARIKQLKKENKKLKAELCKN